MSIGATDFQRAFLAAYASFRATYVETREWQSVWRSSSLWSDRMLYSDSSVIRDTAKSLGLRVHPGEPLRIDAVMTPLSATSWFPIHVAIEHENAPLTLANEVRALASVRAPLKVIVTYAINDYRNPDRIVQNLPGMISAELSSIDALLREDASTQYLFLVGMERPTMEIEWWSMSFAADEGPRGRVFVRVDSRT